MSTPYLLTNQLNMFTRSRLALQDKYITHALANSNFVNDYKDVQRDDFNVELIDLNEKWITLLKKFITTAHKKAKYRIPAEQAGLNRDELFMAYIYMTHGTLPNPLIKTGLSTQSNSLVGSAMYQEYDKMYLQFIDRVHLYEDDEDSLKSASYFMGTIIKSSHDFNYGEIMLKDYK